MKHCRQCKLTQPETTLFCIRCGNSFGVRYCPRLHANPFTADYCHACGSSDLSIANPPRKWSRFGVGLAFALALVTLALTPTILAQVADISPRQYIGAFILVLS